MRWCKQKCRGQRGRRLYGRDGPEKQVRLSPLCPLCLTLTPEAHTANAVYHLKNKSPSTTRQQAGSPAIFSAGGSCRQPLLSSGSWEAELEDAQGPSPLWYELGYDTASDRAWAPTQPAAVPKEGEFRPQAQQPLHLLVTKAWEASCVISKWVCSESSPSRLLARDTSCEYSQASYLLDRSLQQPGPSGWTPSPGPTPLRRGRTGLAPSLTVLLFYISDAAQDQCHVEEAAHYLPPLLPGPGSHWPGTEPGSDRRLCPVWWVAVMWPWILQDWEGSNGSFYDQPAAWTGAGGTWLVWDFFLILEGIRVLLCPWLRSIGGIRDSSYSDLSQYETRVMAQMVKNPPALQETWFNPWVGKIPWKRSWQPLQYSCLENLHGQRSLEDCMQSMGSKRVRHNWETKHNTETRVCHWLNPSHKAWSSWA